MKSVFKNSLFTSCQDYYVKDAVQMQTTAKFSLSMHVSLPTTPVTLLKNSKMLSGTLF